MIKFLIDNGMFDGDQMTVTGKTHNENLADMNHPGLTPGQEIIRPLDDPVKATGHLQIMYGNLCPGGGVAKITGKEGETFTVSDRIVSFGSSLHSVCTSFFDTLYISSPPFHIRVLLEYMTMNNSCFGDLKIKKSSVEML